MSSSGFDSRVKIQQVIENHLPEFILDENPKASEFLKQYYISQEFQGGSIDIAENLDQYLSLNNLTPDVISGTCTLSNSIDSTDTEIYVNSTKGYPSQYGLLKINDEIITYIGITTNSFIGCKRGFSGIVSYHNSINPEELEFTSSKAENHTKDTTVENLSSLFLKEFYKKLKISLAPGFENIDFVSNLNVNNFIKHVKTFYQTKGTEESFRILYNILYGINPKILNLEDFLIKPSQSEFIRREVIVAELISSGNPSNLVGQIIRNYDDTASAPVSEVEIVKRANKTFYKIQLFAGFDDKSLIQGTFEITPKTKIIDKVYPNDTEITVDSTIGFPQNGTLICNNQLISYSDKSINQFFNCDGIKYEIMPTSDIRSDNIIYGYENGDSTKKVELRITGVLSDLKNKNDIYFRSVGDVITVKHLGDKIVNPQNNKTKKEVIFNSWIYNTSSRYEIESFNNNQVTLYDIPDSSSLKVGDYVNILNSNSEDIVLDNAKVTLILDKIIFLDKNIINIPNKTKLSLRKNINYASSSTIPLKYPKIVSDIQNTYNQNDEYIYVASNSLPSYNISKSLVFKTLNITSETNLTSIFKGEKLSIDGIYKYSIISFDEKSPFITGDPVVYTGSNNPIKGLNFNQTYYVEVIESTDPNEVKNKIRLYNSKSFIETNNYVEFEISNDLIGTHTFTLRYQKGIKKISPKKILRKIPLSENIQSGLNLETKPGPVGILVNGVEIINYKSNTKVYYGPLKEVNVINRGFDYDIQNPPIVKISNPRVSTGTTALVDLVIEGNLKNVFVDPNDVDIRRVVSVTLSGGNGSGAVLQPILEYRYKEISFNAQLSSLGGGLNINNETITFLDAHLLDDGTPIIYNQNGNNPLGIGSAGGSNTSQNLYLMNNSVYYPKVINSRAIKLYKTLTDLNSGINTIGFTTSNVGGIHKFKLLKGQQILRDIKVVNSGNGYQNRTLKVKPSGISTIYNTINFVNHGFNDGDLINYEIASGFGYDNPSNIVGLSTQKQYHVIKLNDSSFRLSESGDIGLPESRDNFNRKKYVKFSSSGSGQQIFKYPPIKLNLELEYSGAIGTITATPVLKGKIVDAYLYENGTDYGSNIIDFERKPTITIKNGSSAQLRPIINYGTIIGIDIQNPGSEYTSSPNLIINGSGLGAKLRPVVENGRIIDVVIINGGSNYDPNTTFIQVESSGKNALLDCKIRSLTLNNQKRFSDEILLENVQNDEDLFYGIVGYSTEREGSAFSDPNPSTLHSKIIGWSYDGNPIYGPYGYSDPNNSSSPIKLLKSGYNSNTSNIFNRPNGFDLGFFVEDYQYNTFGDLDIHNGRYSKTPEFPNGIYAYYVGVTTDINTNKLTPQFPYFIGNNYRSNIVVDTTSDQNYNFNDSNLCRNTFPYRIKEFYSGNDFIVESNELYKQNSLVESVSSGTIQSIKILNPGDNYTVGDSIIFDNEDTGGAGASAIVDSILGKHITEITTETSNYENAIITRKNKNQIEVIIDPYHNLLDGDNIQISGISTNKINNLVNNHIIGVTTSYSSLIYDIPSNGVVGLITDIYISPFPNNVSVGSAIGIGTELLKVLNIFKDQNILKVSRGISGYGHTSSTRINFYPNKFLINLNTDYFDSNYNEKIYFDPTTSVGLSTITGSSTDVNFYLGKDLKTVSIESQSIYLPNHPFKTNQRVLFTKPNGSGSFVVRNNPTSSNFNFPNSGNSQYAYIINKSKDFIGIVTQPGLTTTSSGLYFIGGFNSGAYSFEPTFNQITGNVAKIVTQVSVSTSHNLSFGDVVNLKVNPKLLKGNESNSSVVVEHNSNQNKIIINPVGFTSADINTTLNQIHISSHNFSTGQKVFYDSRDLISSGLSTGGYFVYRVDNDYISLCDTYIDSLSTPPRIVSIGSSGGSLHKLGLINPQLKITRNNNIIFDLSSSTLNNYKLKLFFDEEKNNEFISCGNNSNFLVSTDEINKNLTIDYDDTIPSTLYYSLEEINTGDLVPIDNEVNYASQIIYTNSLYNGEYKIFGIGSTTFNINLKNIPEKSTYQNNECDIIEYSTKSKTASGGIYDAKIIYGGENYNKLPTIVGVSTLSLGSNAILKPISTNIGKIEQIRIIDEGFDYPSDKTLRVKSEIPRLIRIKDSNKVSNILVSYGGKNFISSPTLSLVNDYTRKKINSGSLSAKLFGNSIGNIEIIENPKGLQSVSHTLFTENNSNGIKVNKVVSYVDGIVTCELSTPAVDGFLIPPFAIGDSIFVEGIQKQYFTNNIGIVTSPGNGFNSKDNGYVFFKVVDYINSNPAILSYDVGEYTSNAGIPEEFQIYFTSIINKKNYPTFKVNTNPSIYFIGEKLIINKSQSDLIVESSYKNYITVSGTKILSYNDSIEGLKSGNISKVDESLDFLTEFNINYSNKKNYGWKTNIGTLNDSLQVLEDNNYYQNLSYSIKTTGEKYKNNKVIDYDTTKSFVNGIVHPVGLKNFADVGITSSAKVGIGSQQIINKILDLISEERVDTFNDFDLSFDYNPSQTYSEAIVLKNKKLSDYIECISNRVLQIDDISSKFSSQEFNRNNFEEVYEYPVTDFFSKFLIQVSDEEKKSYQSSEIVVLNNFDNTYTLNKSDIFTGNELIGNFSGSFSDNGNIILKFEPLNPFDYNYNIKIYRDYFYDVNYNIGVGHTDLGFVRLESKVKTLSANLVNPNVGITTDIFTSLASSINSVYSNVFILNNLTLDMNYFEVLAHHDGNNGYINEYYFDTENNKSGSSFGFIGTFGVSVDNGIFKLLFTNNDTNSITVKSKTVGFNTISSGIGTYRFLVDDQESGTEKSARLESSYQVSIGSTEIIKYTLGYESTLKSLIRVGIGSTVALHQIHVVSDLENVTIKTYPFLSVGTPANNGIGTFGAHIESSNVIISFYPDNAFSSDSITIQKFNQFLYSEVDEFNVPYALNYGIGLEELQTAFYGSLNNFGKDRLSFDLNYKSIPIFSKSFNPNNSQILDKETGIFTIKNHFFQNEEELIYTPGTVIESDIAPLGIGTTLVNGKYFIGDSILGFSTITGIDSLDNIAIGDFIEGASIPSNTTVVSLGSTYTYFIGNVVSGGSSIISGIGNTSKLIIGSGIYSGNNQSLGTIVSIGINSITSSNIIPEGNNRIYYSTNLNYGLTLSQVSTATTIRQNYNTGILTDICPSTVYAIKIDENKFKITGSKGQTSIGFTFTSSGIGNYHKFEMRKKNEKCLITVDGVNQYPLRWTPITHNLQYNGGSIGIGQSFIALSGISSITPKDLIKIENEFLGVINVGFGTTNTGPILGDGTVPLIQVYRGFVGTSATVHIDGSEVRVYKGSYNIVGNKINFTEAPDGRGNNFRLNSSGLVLPRSSFNGRVFLRKNYSNNLIYDDLSNQFSGIGRTFNLTVEGNNTSGIEAGNGLVFINDVFQTPDTENNSGNNYTLESSNVSGISTITFTSITRPNTDEVVITPYDVNQNQIPRGGIIISLGSTGGLGYAPLVGASVTAIIGLGGSITAIGIGSTDICGSGYRGSVSIGVTDSTGIGASIRAVVGAGGSLSFTIINGGSGYTSPIFEIDDPTYENLSIKGISRISIGETTQTGIGLSMTINVSSSSVEGIGKSFFEVKSFNITKPGYSFMRGDKFEVVGLVTDARLNSPISKLVFTVEETFSDTFSAIQLGEFDFIDNIKSLQNGIRKRFPLYRNGELLSFEKNRGDLGSSQIDFDSVLLIYINGVMQEPGKSYKFDGGTTFRFIEPPRFEDNVAIFFYRGTKGIDSKLVNVTETIKPGDIVQINRNNNNNKTISQSDRTVGLIASADLIETGIYFGEGIDGINEKPINWSKQKRDLIINESIQFKSRDSLETFVVPTAKIIRDVSPTDNEIFVDDIQLFNYEENESSLNIDNFSGLLISPKESISAVLTPVVSSSSTISSILIENPGSGYIPNSTIDLKISNSVGIGVTAIATASVSSLGKISNITIVNSGFGYTSTNLPQILCQTPPSTLELIPEIKFVEGYSGIITGITTTNGYGSNPLALRLYVKLSSPENANSLLVGYPILVSQTNVGNGITSIDLSNNSIIGIGTTFLDNIYKIQNISILNYDGIIDCNILSTTNTNFISTSGIFCGRFSWGRISGITRKSNPISLGVSGYTVNSGLSTFPQLLRRGVGLRDTGGLIKILPSS